GDRLDDRALVLHAHAVADPRARHAGLPALARAPRPRPVEGRTPGELRGGPRPARSAAARPPRGGERRQPSPSRVISRSFVRLCSARTRRTVPDRERMTIDSVVAVLPR